MTLPRPVDPLFLSLRRQAISRSPTQIGINYVTVTRLSASTWQLAVYFIPWAPVGRVDPEERRKDTRPEPPLTPEEVVITAVAPAVAVNMQVIAIEYPNQGNLVLMTVGHVDGEGVGARSLPLYQLTITRGENVDPFFNSATFSLSTVVVADFGPGQPTPKASPPATTPTIDYLSKDYESFRQLMLNRLSFLIPNWSEGSPADVGVTLVEVLAYAADQLSYYQDAVATETYLETARQRISMRRHARLLDYRMHEGCNARAWVHLHVAEEVTLPDKTILVTDPGLETSTAWIFPEQYEDAINHGAVAFETLDSATLYPEQNALEIYIWGATEVTLPAGATGTTLLTPPGPSDRAHLQPGDVLVFVQLAGRPPVDTPPSASVDPTHRWAVRLTSVTPTVDPLGGLVFDPSETGDPEPIPIIEVTWAAADALPFAFIVTNDPDRPDAVTSIALGNIVLADQGRPAALTDQGKPAAETLPKVFAGARYRPTLSQVDLTFRVPYDDAEARLEPAVDATRQDPRLALPALDLTSKGSGVWQPRRDLLSSIWSSRDFVVEMESDRTAHLRFGDGTYGERPVPGEQFCAYYRVGNGPAGNVGAQTITRYLVPDQMAQIDQPDGAAHHGHFPIRFLYNPLPAQGGIAPEPIEQVRLNAPQALHVQDRCVTDEDFAMIAERFPGVRQAYASRQWTGSWPTVFLAVDREGSLPVDETFRRRLRRFMEPTLLIGTDLKIVPPSFISLEIALRVHVAASYYPDLVRQELLAAFSSTPLPQGRTGFFDPSNFSFAQPVYLSQVVACACDVPGVEWVEVERFGRWHDPATRDLTREEIAIGPTEVARLANDPNAPELGQIFFDMVERARP